MIYRFSERLHNELTTKYKQSRLHSVLPDTSHVFIRYDIVATKVIKEITRKEETMRHPSYIMCAITGIFMVLIVLAGAGAGLQGVLAQSDNTEQPGDDARGQGIEISPPRIELNADPGETVTTEIHIRNITDLEVLVQGAVNNFVSGDESGEPRILFEEDEESPFPLKDYISDVPDLTLKPHERRAVQVTVNVPEDAAPGGHFGLVRFSAIPAESEGGASEVNLSASIGTLILLNVSGEIEESLVIEELAASKSLGEEDSEEDVSLDQNKGSFFETGPITLITRLNNTGNVHLQPSGSLTVSNMLGQEVGGKAFNKSQGNVLPGSIRRFEHEFNDKEFWFGRYTATAQLQYGSEDTTLKETVAFWVIPYKIITVVLVMLVAVGYFGRKALQAYKRNIVKKYQQQNSGRDGENQEPPEA